MAYIMEDDIPNTLMFHKPETLLDITLKDGTRRNGIKLIDVDWRQLGDGRARVIAWSLSKNNGSVSPTPQHVNECVEKQSGFDNISIVSGCVVAYRTGDVAHPVLVLKEKRPVEYMKICSLMGLGDEEGIKDVLRGIFDK